uniref:MATH domain-containing protein n=1 Tax=Brassica campestris TaxID=3711 RepID=M4E3C8_BRACM
MSEITKEDSEICKKEIRSNVFEIGGLQWYILFYPQGCEICNHLSVFLCAASHQKLLPDTLHKFYKREHDWGWKNFIELPRLLDGFIDDSGSLIIKAQVQVIRKSVNGPFPCLDSQYRKELLRVYFKVVKQIFLRFMKEKRNKLMEDKTRWTSLCAFWLGMDQKPRRAMSREKMDVIQKLVVKHFFINKNVTSPLVMDFLFKGLNSLVLDTNKEKIILTISKQIVRLLKDDSDASEKTLKTLEDEPKKEIAFAAKELAVPIVSVDNDMFVLADDAMLLLEKAVLEPFPDERVPPNRMEVDYDEESDDEKLLTEYARHTLEVFVLDHIFCNKIEIAYKEASELKMHEELIR